MKIIQPLHLLESVRSLYDSGLPSGFTTGWPSVDQFYTVAPGQLTIITGYPGSGKSEWLDALAINLCPQQWMFAVHSPENLPHELHLSKLLEKIIKKPFSKGRTERMEWADVDDGLHEIQRRFRFLAPKSQTEPVTLEAIIEEATTTFDDAPQSWHHGLIIDPWNELDHARPREISETEYISYSLSRLRAWARAGKVHVWIVAHPQKLRRLDDGKLPIPTPDSISGSQHWWNKADACITVHRDLSKKSAGLQYNQDVEIHVQKIRFKHIGHPGLAVIRYDKITGRYYEAPPHEA